MTRLTKTGQPVMGTTLAVKLTDGTTEQAKVVGKGIGTDGRTLVCIWVEWDDGTRQQLPWDGLEWEPTPRAVVHPNGAAAHSAEGST